MEYERHVELVKRYLVHLDEQHHQCLNQFETLKSEMPLFTPALAYQIEELVRKHALPTVNIYFDTIIALLKYDYLDRFMQLQYVRQKPTQEQVCFHSLSSLQIEFSFIDWQSESYLSTGLCQTQS